LLFIFVVKKNAGKKKILGWHVWATIVVLYQLRDSVSTI